MATAVHNDGGPASATAARPYLWHRHSLAVRLTHWINALAIVFLIATGLNIFNAHPGLYWGQFGADNDDSRRWLEIGSDDDAAGKPYGFVRIGSLTVHTTGFLGISKNAAGRDIAIAYPSWATFPSYRDLGTARNWHFFFAWVLILNGLLYLGYSLAAGHLRKDLLPKRKELSVGNIVHDVVQHARLKFPKGEDSKRYHILQKLAYAGVILVLVPGIIFTGLGMSPVANSWLPIVEIVGGRPTARSLHWIFANLIILFIIVHLVMVVLAGPYNEVRSMITGKFRVDPEKA